MTQKNKKKNRKNMRIRAQVTIYEGRIEKLKNL